MKTIFRMAMIGLLSSAAVTGVTAQTGSMPATSDAKTPASTAAKPSPTPAATPTPAASSTAPAPNPTPTPAASGTPSPAPASTPTPAASGPVAASASTTTASAAAPAGPNPTVGGAEMFPTKTIVENASASKDHTTLVTAVKAAGLVETLSGPGPFTVFAPVNDAFTRLAPGTVDTLLKPENKATLTKVLTYHVVPGKLLLADLNSQITAGGGTATLTTVEGEPLKVAKEGEAMKITDVNGNASYIMQADVLQSNGVVYVVNGVLLPKL